MSIHNWVTIGAICVVGISSIIANALYNKYSDNCTKYGHIHIALYFLTVLNFATDILTAFVMVEYYLNESTYRRMSTILCLASLITLIIPYISNFIFGLKNTKSCTTLLCIILSGDTFTSLRLNKNKTLCKPAKWLTILFQNLPQIAIQALFIIIISKQAEILFIISMAISLITCVEGLISFRHKVSKVRKYAIKLQFNVSETEKKSMKKSKLNRDLKALLRTKLTDALLITKDQAVIGDITFDEMCVEIEVIHAIPHEIGNDIDYVSNMYRDQMDKIGGIISQIYELYETENIKPKLITDKSSALMIMNSTSFRSIPIVTTPSTLELDQLNARSEQKTDEESAEKRGNNEDEESLSVEENENKVNDIEKDKDVKNEEYVNPNLWDTKDAGDVDI